MKECRSFVWVVATACSFAAFHIASTGYGQLDPDSKVVLAQNKFGDQAHRIRKDVRQMLDEIIFPAVNSNHYSEFFDAFQLIVTKSNGPQLEEIEAYCLKEGQFSFKRIYIDELLLRIQEGQVSNTIKVPYEHALYIATGLKDRIDREMVEILKFEFFDPNFKLPDQWRDAESLFWDSHVINNRFHNVKAIADVTLQTITPHYLRYRKNDKQDRLESLLPFLDLPRQIEEEYFRFKGFDAAHHVHQLRFAASRLRLSKDFEDRLYAAYAIHDAKTKIDSYLRETPAEQIHLEEFRDSNFKNALQEIINQANIDGFDVMEKAVLLRVGTHWWLRGRYGMGPLANGLLKVPEAVTDQQVMFGLYMPKKPEKPISMYLSEEDAIQGYDRRHYYNWAVEYRPRFSSDSRDVNSMPVGEQVTLGMSSYFW